MLTFTAIHIPSKTIDAQSKRGHGADTVAIRITDKLVKDLTPPASGNRISYDDEIGGFGIRITAAGARAFVLNYRIAGRERRMKIGRYPEWSVERARKQAKDLKRSIDMGNDPLGAKQATRSAPTVADLCDRYEEEHLPSKRASSARDDKAMIAKIIRPKLGSEKVAAIEQSQIAKLHRSLKDKPYRANRVLALLSKMFSLAHEWKMRPDNPAKGVKKFGEEKRERYLTPAEIGALVKVLDAREDQDIANIIRLLLLTGARSGEVRSATWSQFDLEKGVWAKPAATTKQKKVHRVALSEGAVLLLKAIYEAAPRDDGGNLKSDLLFPAPRSGKIRTEFKKEWESIATAAGIWAAGDRSESSKHCRIHDLRHTYASILVSARLSLPIIGQLLGHTQVATTARYTHLYDDAQREATNIVSAVVTGKKSADIVPIRGAQG